MRGLLIVMLLFLCIACKTTTKYVEVEVPVEIEKVRVEYQNKLYKDSIFIHDSIDRYVSGDTVYQLKYQYIYKYMNRVDTVYKTDSIQVPVEIKSTQIETVTKEVEKPLHWYQSVLMYLGFGCIAILIFLIVRFVRKRFFKVG